MLEELQQIVLDVGEAKDLTSALDTIVHGVRVAMKMDTCSIYLVDPDDSHLVLTATEGLDKRAIGHVRLAFGEGLVGVVGAQRRALLAADAPSHPQYKYFEITGEEQYQSFLGVPVIHYRKLVGVLIVQAVSVYDFRDDDIAFLVTISAQLAGAVHGAALGEHLRVTRLKSTQSQLQGVPGAPGVAIGIPVLPSPFSDLAQVGDRDQVDAILEEQLFLQAVTEVKADLRDGRERLRDVLPNETIELLQVYNQLVSDELLHEKTIHRIRQGQWAPAALRDTIQELSEQFAVMEDERFRARGEDIRAVGRRVLLKLHPDARQSYEYPDRCILVGNEVSIARIADVPPEKLSGIICNEGSVLSHTALLAKSMGIPAVMGIGKIPPESFSSGLVIVDGYQGRVFANPVERVLKEFRRFEREEQDLEFQLRSEEKLPALTPDGKELPVRANITLLTDIEPALRAGASGVGLYRTEFPFMIRESFPGEDEQTAIYEKMLAAFVPDIVVMRTLDIGGDKQLPYFKIDDRNPALGWRGIRVSLNHPEIFLTQIRAMLRANIDKGNLQIMLPMVSTISEIDEARLLIETACADLKSEGLEVTNPPLGAMIEIPSLLYQIPQLAGRVDFCSIGTNDLTQYLLAADRDNPGVAELYDHLQPSVLTAIYQTITTAQEVGMEVTVCGELGSDPSGAILLLGMGVDALSVAPSGLAKIKWVIRSFTCEKARDLLHRALQQYDVQAVRRLLRDALEEAGLGGLIRAGK